MNLKTIRAQIPFSDSKCKLMLDYSYSLSNKTSDTFCLEVFYENCLLSSCFMWVPKNYPHIYVLQQYEKIAPRTSWLCCFCGWCFSMVQLGETTEPLFSFPPWDLSTHIQVAFLKHSLAEQKDKEAWESWRCWCKGLYKKWALMISSNLTLQLS